MWHYKQGQVYIDIIISQEVEREIYLPVIVHNLSTWIMAKMNVVNKI